MTRIKNSALDYIGRCITILYSVQRGNGVDKKYAAAARRYVRIKNSKMICGCKG